MSTTVSESPFAPESKSCARCARWSGARRAVSTGDGVIVMAVVSDAVKARCDHSSVSRKASEGCSRFQGAYN